MCAAGPIEPLKVLRDDQISRIHDASIEILQTVGVRIPHPEVRRLFGEAGADVDGEIVRIPERLVMESVAMKDEILRTHEPEPLDADTVRELDQIVAAARKHLT